QGVRRRPGGDERVGEGELLPPPAAGGVSGRAADSDRVTAAGAGRTPPPSARRTPTRPRPAVRGRSAPGAARTPRPAPAADNVVRAGPRTGRWRTNRPSAPPAGR